MDCFGGFLRTRNGLAYARGELDRSLFSLAGTFGQQRCAGGELREPVAEDADPARDSFDVRPQSIGVGQRTDLVVGGEQAGKTFLQGLDRPRQLAWPDYALHPWRVREARLPAAQGIE